MQIQDNVFIITGGASGLGAATARMLTAAGGKVVLADLQVEAGQALAAELNGVFVRCDVTSEEDGLAVVAAAAGLGTLRGLVNCAGVAPAVKTVGKDGPHPLALFQKVVNINLVGTFNMCRLAADAMGKLDATSEGERGNEGTRNRFHGFKSFFAYRFTSSPARNRRWRPEPVWFSRRGRAAAAPRGNRQSR